MPVLATETRPLPSPVDATPDGLRAFLAAEGLTHAQLADWLGVAEHTVTRWAGGGLRIGNPRGIGLALEALAVRLAAGRLGDPFAATLSRVLDRD